MLINKPPVRAGQLDRCEVCGNKHHRDKLVRTQVEWLYPAHQNAFTYSSYDGTFWVCDATDASTISWGNRGDRTRYVINDDNTTSILNGVQTWTGDGTFYCTTAPTTGAATTDNVIFSCQIGPNDLNPTPEMTVVLGDCDTDGNNKTVKKTLTISGTSKVWFSWTGAEAALGQGCYYIQVTNDDDWWVDELQLEVNSKVDTPGTFVATSGTAVSATAEAGSISTRVVCQDCFESVFKRSEKYGRINEPPTDGPVSDYTQEF
jgi:hypothetical protein